MGEVRYRVSGVSMGFMIAIAAIFDLLQFLLTLTVIGSLLAWLVTVFAGMIFFVWFLILGINYFSGKKAAAKVGTILSTSVLEFIPILNALPTITIGVITIALVSRMEDRMSAKERV
jgi:hypothetical protein